MNSINREQFEAWLFSQPDNREFNFMQGGRETYPGCVVCNFLRENTGIVHEGVGGDYFRVNDEIFKFEWWLKILLHERIYRENQIIFANEMKSAYLKLFPNAIVGNTQPSAIAEKVENVSIAQVTSGNLANAEFAAHQ